ncbi:MAG: cytochrome c oxidase assembly protein [Alphaproteobacteria bacterium PA4]|nr:MAG: cytochrome c oxidase assembly protein [Alphaproteobacteria bacterium PA4]
MSELALARAKRRTGVLTALLALAMIGLAYASVPLYRMFCEATGFAGTTNRADAAALPDALTLKALGGRTIKVRFDGNVAPDVAWRFGPKAHDITVRIGEKKLAYFTATSLSGSTTTGRAGFNVSPDVAGLYFRKIECFCFTEQTLKPGETVDMPVTFFIDPAILNDPDAKKIDEITLSYTFFPVDNPVAKPVSATATNNTTSKQG